MSFLHLCGVIVPHKLLIFLLPHDDKELGFGEPAQNGTEIRSSLVLYQGMLAVLYFSHIFACVHSSCLCINIASKLAAYFSDLH